MTTACSSGGPPRYSGHTDLAGAHSTGGRSRFGCSFRVIQAAGSQPGYGSFAMTGGNLKTPSPLQPFQAKPDVLHTPYNCHAQRFPHRPLKRTGSYLAGGRIDRRSAGLTRPRLDLHFTRTGHLTGGQPAQARAHSSAQAFRVPRFPSGGTSAARANTKNPIRAPRVCGLCRQDGSHG